MTATVLYIEDNEDNIRLVQRIMKRRPAITLAVATNGQHGLQHAQTQPPTLILLDRRLPDMLGDQVLHALKSSPDTARIPAAMISGDDIDANQLELDVDEILPKPFDIARLLTIVDRICGDPQS